MASQVKAILDALTTDLKRLGVFDAGVDTVEPKDVPAEGLSGAIYFGGIRFAGNASGLDFGSAVYTYTFRIYSNALQIPAEDIDPDLVVVVDKVMDALCGDFTLSGQIRNVDVFGMYGQALEAKAGHINISGTMCRAIDVTIPLVVNDVVELTP